MNSRIAKRLRRLTALLLLTAFLLSMFASGASAASARTKAAYLGPMATPFDGTFGAMFPGASPDRKTKLLLKTIDAIPDGAASRFVVTYGAPGLRNFTWAATEEGERLTRAMDALDGFPLDFVMLDLTTGRGIAYLPDETMYSASCMKGPYVAAVCQYQTSRVTASWQKQMRLAIVESDNGAYRAVHKKYGTKGMAKLMETAGVDSFDPSKRYASLPPEDLAKLWVAMYQYLFLSTETDDLHTWCRRLFLKSRESFFRDALPGQIVYSKPGWLDLLRYNTRNDAGIIIGKDRNGNRAPYVLVVMSSAYGKDAELRELTRALDGVHTLLAS